MVIFLCCTYIHCLQLCTAAFLSNLQFYINLIQCTSLLCKLWNISYQIIPILVRYSYILTRKYFYYILYLCVYIIFLLLPILIAFYIIRLNIFLDERFFYLNERVLYPHQKLIFMKEISMYEIHCMHYISIKMCSNVILSISCTISTQVFSLKIRSHM